MLQFYNLGWWNYSDTIAHPWIAASRADLHPDQLRSLSRLAVPQWVPYRALPHSLRRPLHHSAHCLRVPALRRVRRPHSRWSGRSSSFQCSAPPVSSLPVRLGYFSRHCLPRSPSRRLCIILGGTGLWVCVRVGGAWPLGFVECAIHIATALLVFYVFRRVSPGTVLAGLGFLAWSAQYRPVSPVRYQHRHRHRAHSRHRHGQGRCRHRHDPDRPRRSARRPTRRPRTANVTPARNWKPIRVLRSRRRRIDDFDHQSTLICQTIVANSRFTQAALILLQNSGQYRLAGAAGFDDATVNALEALLRPHPRDGLPRSSLCHTRRRTQPDLQTRSRAFSCPRRRPQPPQAHHACYAIPLRGRSTAEGALFLTGLCDSRRAHHRRRPASARSACLAHPVRPAARP